MNVSIAPRRRTVVVVDQTTTTTSIVETKNHFPPFNLENDIQVVQFVVLIVEQIEVCVGILLFYVRKLVDF